MLSKGLTLTAVSASGVSLLGAVDGSDLTAWTAAIVAVATALVSLIGSVFAAVRTARRANADDVLTARWKAFALGERERAIHAGQTDPFPGGLPPLDPPPK